MNRLLLRPAYITLLCRIAEIGDGPLTQTVISRRLGLSSAWVSYGVRALEHAGFLKRADTDQRTHHVSLTPAGENRVERERAAPPTYQMRSLLDFLSVPADRRAACLDEFATWLDGLEATTALLEGITLRWPSKFVWVDDGKHELEVVVEGGGQRIEIAKGVMRGVAE